MRTASLAAAVGLACLAVPAVAQPAAGESTMASPVFAFFKLVVRDMARMEAFYTQALGMKRRAYHDLPTVEEVVLAQSGVPFSLVLYRDKASPDIVMGTGHGPVGFRVDDVDAVAAELVEAGAELTRPPFSLGASRIAFLTDPEGHPLELISSGAAN